MKKHVDVLGLLYVLAGAINLLLGVSLLILGLGALSIVVSADSERREIAAGLTAVSFLVIAAIVLIWGIVNVGAGAAIRRHRPWARAAGLVVAVLNLFVLPFGTPLGIYSLWVLLSNHSRELFHPV